MASVKSRNVDDVVVLSLNGMFTGGEETDQLAAALDKAFVAGTRKVVVNLKDATYLTSMSIGVFLQARHGFLKHGGRIVLSNVSDRINAVFLITKLILVFETFDDEAEALASFEGWVAPAAQSPA